MTDKKKFWKSQRAAQWRYGILKGKTDYLWKFTFNRAENKDDVRETGFHGKLLQLLNIKVDRWVDEVEPKEPVVGLLITEPRGTQAQVLAIPKGLMAYIKEAFWEYYDDQMKEG